MKGYGKELVMDLHNCNFDKFNRKELKKFFVSLCKEINMVRAPLHFWDYKGYEDEYEKDPDHIKGTSAVQFIRTSNITVHCLDVFKSAYVNVFSCKEFDSNRVVTFCENFFEGKVVGEPIEIVRR